MIQLVQQKQTLETQGSLIDHLQEVNKNIPSQQTCPNPRTSFKEQTFLDLQAPDMALREAAERIAAQFDFPPSDVNKAVKEFLNQLGKLSHTAH